MNVFYSPINGSVYLVPNHHSHSLQYVEDTLEYAKTIGLTVPEKKDIKFEVLAGRRYKRMLSIEFNSKTKPSIEFIDLDLYPHLAEDLCY